MQKKLLTMAVAGALAAPCIALAQSSVEVYGTINMAFGKFKYDQSAAGAPSVSKWDVANGASNYGLRGRENLGGGLTSWFQIEQNAPLERSNNIAITPSSRNSAVGIQGAFGNVFVGQWTTPWADLDALWAIGTVGFWGPVTSTIGRRETTGAAPNPNCNNAGRSPGVGICDAVISGGGVGHPFWRRASQALAYQSPVFGGVQIKALYQTNEGKATGGQPGGAAVIPADPSLWSASAQWAGMGGRARIGAAIDRHKDFTTIGKSDTGWSVKGGFNFGVADVGLAYENLTYRAAVSDCKTKGYGAAVAVPVGPGSIRGSWSKTTAIAGTYTGAMANAASTTGSCGATPTATAPSDQNASKEFNIGYEHRFSKRTNVGVGYAKIKNDPGAVNTWTGAPPTQTGGAVTAANVPLPGSSPSTYFVSITHRF